MCKRPTLARPMLVSVRNLSTWLVHEWFSLLRHFRAHIFKHQLKQHQHKHKHKQHQHINNFNLKNINNPPIQRKQLQILDHKQLQIQDHTNTTIYSKSIVGAYSLFRLLNEQHWDLVGTPLRMNRWKWAITFHCQWNEVLHWLVIEDPYLMSHFWYTCWLMRRQECVLSAW